MCAETGPETPADGFLRRARELLSRPPEPAFAELALALYRKALDPDPTRLDALLGMARCCHRLSRDGEVASWGDEALRLHPRSPSALFSRCMLSIPVLYDRPQDIEACREEYAWRLKLLEEQIDLSTPAAVRDAASAVGSAQPFLLAHQSRNDAELHRTYGRLVTRVLSARHPGFAVPPAPPPRSGDEPIRVGFVSGQFHSHSVWKVITRGWLEELDRRRFSVHAYSVRSRPIPIPEEVRTLVPRLVEGPMSLTAWCERIRSDRLHVLVHTETGMDPTALQLAGLRLAPIQGVASGHYDTSGLPTLDFFLSGSLVEADDAASHYTEDLVRLANLGLRYVPSRVSPSSRTRTSFGLRDSAVVYYSGHTLFKFLPHHDDRLARIAAQVGDCQIVFLEDRRSWGVTRRFRSRLRLAFERHGLDLDRHAVFVPRLSGPDFDRLMQVSDVFLDTIGYSGWTATLESLAFDLPIVTLPSPYARGRSGQAILRMLGIPETLASDVDGYVAVAVRLGLDPAFRREVSARVAAGKRRVYGDAACVRDLEEFLERVAS